MSKTALKGALEAQTEIVKQTASIIPFLVKTVVVCGIGWYAYHKFINRFISLKEKSNYPDSNVTDAEAKTRADAIYGSIGWFSNSFDAVANNLTGLNYNGFIRVYNAFGEHYGTLLGGNLNLIEWLKNQFSDNELAQLSALQNGVFF